MFDCLYYLAIKLNNINIRIEVYIFLLFLIPMGLISLDGIKKPLNTKWFYISNCVFSLLDHSRM